MHHACSTASQTFTINAKLDDSGTLEGKVERTIQGDDNEFLLRSAFRRVPMPQWKDLVQQISYGSGFAGARFRAAIYAARITLFRPRR